MNKHINPMLTKLRLGGMAQSLEVRLHEASSTGLTHLEFFELMLQDEINIREDRQITRRIQKAGFRDVRRLEDFDFSFNTTIKKSLVFELATGRFIRERRDVLWLGPPGDIKDPRSLFRSRGVFSVLVLEKWSENKCEGGRFRCQPLFRPRHSSRVIRQFSDCILHPTVDPREIQRNIILTVFF